MMLPYDCFVGSRGAAAGCCPTSDQDCLVGRRDLCDSGTAAGGFSCHSAPCLRQDKLRRRVDSFVPALLLSDILLDCDSSSRSVPTPTNTRHGYTGHEHLDKFALINMNGRVYDPVIGRFLSPDPVLQDPSNAQNYNKYSYVLNNPLKFTDPSGYRGQRVYRLQAPDMLAENRKLNMDREAHWQAMHGGGDETYAFLSVMCGGGGGGGDMFGTNTTTSTLTCEDVSGPDGEEPTVTNNSSKPIMVKPEKGDEYIILEPGESYYGEVDGFTFPYAEGLEIYKVGDPFAGDLWEVYDDDIDMAGDLFGAAKESNDALWGEVTPTWIINDLRTRGWNPEPTLDGWRPLFEFNYYNYHNF